MSLLLSIQGAVEWKQPPHWAWNVVVPKESTSVLPPKPLVTDPSVQPVGLMSPTHWTMASRMPMPRPPKTSLSALDGMKAQKAIPLVVSISIAGKDRQKARSEHTAVICLATHLFLFPCHSGSTPSTSDKGDGCPLRRLPCSFTHKVNSLPVCPPRPPYQTSGRLEGLGMGIGSTLAFPRRTMRRLGWYQDEAQDRTWDVCRRQPGKLDQVRSKEEQARRYRPYQAPRMSRDNDG